MSAIWEAQQETGTPYITYKDSVNRKSNQMNIGTIKSSNLCNEIVEYSDMNEHAVCNLASIALNKMLDSYDFSEKEFIVYTKPNCRYCKWSKNYLDYYGASYTEVIFDNTIENMTSSLQIIKDKDEVVKKIKTFENGNNVSNETLTFPQIFVRNIITNETDYIGGFENMYKTLVPTYNFDKLYDVVYTAIKNLNQVIDINYYPTIETKRSNMKHRPIGLGVQGLADTLALMRIPFDSDEALQLNKDIMETIYYASLKASNDISFDRLGGMKKLINWYHLNNNKAFEYYDKSLEIEDEEINSLYHSLRPNKFELEKEDSTYIGSYSSFKGSPASKGLLQFDLWGLDGENPNKGKYNWLELKEKIKTYGIRNSLLVALMPTASTSQILGNNECFEYYTSNIYTRNTLAGDFIIINKHMVNDLISIGEWDENLKDLIIAADGSIQHIRYLPKTLLRLFQSQWEMKQVWVLKAAKCRGPFVDQTQSMNIFMDEPNDQKLNSTLFWGWKNGLKTGMYYLRSKPATNAVKITIDPSIIKKIKDEEEECVMCSA